MIKKIIDFITYGVWLKTENDFSGKRWWAVKQLRVILFTAKGFGRHDTAIRSAALSFFTVMSLVPILALVFVIFKGFGMEATFTKYLYDMLPDNDQLQNYTVIVDKIVEFIDNLLMRTKGGVMAIGAFFVLIWAVIQVFGNVEGAFNKIWEVKRSRSFARRFSAYMALIIIVPILLLTANSAYIGIRTEVELFTGNLVAELLFGFLSVAIVVFMFSIIYFVLPNTDVKYKNALKAGVVAGIGFSLFQVIYVSIQGNLSAYNAIYGTFAAIPLFLLWLQISWQIVLFGGELSFAMQNISDFASEQQAENVSYDNRCKIMIATMVVVIRNYLDGNLSTTEHIAREIGAPVRTVREVARELEEDGLLLFVENEKTEKVDSMVPARDPRSIRFFDVINAVTEYGGEMPGIRETHLMKRIDETYEKVKGDIKNSGDNIPLTELI
jgi:membrane protein